MAPSFRNFVNWLASYSSEGGKHGGNGSQDGSSGSLGEASSSASMSFRSSLLDDLNDAASGGGGGLGSQIHGGGGHDPWPSDPILRRVVRRAAAAAVPTLITPTPSVDMTTKQPEPTEPPGPGFAEKAVGKIKGFAESAGSGVGNAIEKAKHLPENELVIAASEKTKVPIWGILLIAVGCLILSLCCCCYCIRRQWRKFKSSDKFKAMADNKLLGKFVTEDDKKAEGDLAALTKNEEEIAEEGAGEEPKKDEVLGKISYKLEYDFNSNSFMVHILQIEELIAMDSSGTSDPYVKVFFPGEKKYKFETKVHRKTLSPQFNETFVFKNLPFMDLMAKVLFIQVFDFDRFSSHDQIGEIRITLCQIDLTVPLEESKYLDPPVDEDNERLGDICFSLRYVPTTGKLTICIIECKNLKKMDLGGLADPFVKINLYEKGKKLQKKKTSVKQNTLNPYFNEAFTFEIPEAQLEKFHFVLTTLDYDLIGACTPIGRVAVGPNQTGQGLQHWQEMINTPRRPIALWHTLIHPQDPQFQPPPSDKKKK